MNTFTTYQICIYLSRCGSNLHHFCLFKRYHRPKNRHTIQTVLYAITLTKKKRLKTNAGRIKINCIYVYK